MKDRKKPGRKPRVSMAKCRDRIAWLAAKLKRPVTAKDVVKDAKAHKDAATHNWFTWNIRKAAGKRWLDEARRLIGRIKVTYYDAQRNAVSAREYVNVIQEEAVTHRLTRGYVDRPQVLQSTDLKRQCVETARKELEVWKARWKTFPEIEITYHIIDTVIMQLQKIRFRKITGGRPRRSKKKAR